MSAFEDEFEVPPASEVDPAAEFLAKEQEELGDIGQDLGLGAPAQDPAAVPDAGDVLGTASEEDDGKDIYAGMQTLSIKKDKEEPEHMRKWKEEQQERLMKKDQEESAAMEELKVKAKQELEDWYKRYETQVEKTKSSNREEETKYEIGALLLLRSLLLSRCLLARCSSSRRLPASYMVSLCHRLHWLLLAMGPSRPGRFQWYSAM